MISIKIKALMKKSSISKNKNFKTRNVKIKLKAKKKKKNRSTLNHVEMKREETQKIEDKEKKERDHSNFDIPGFDSIKNISYTIIINPKAPQLKVSIMDNEMDNEEVDE